MMRKIVLGGLASAIIAAPLAAETDIGRDAAGDSRSSAPVEGESALAGQAPFVFLAGIAAIVAAIVFLSQDDDPASP